MRYPLENRVMFKLCWYLLAILFTCKSTLHRLSQHLSHVTCKNRCLVPDSIIGSFLFCDTWPDQFGRLDLSITTVFSLLVGNFNLDHFEDEPTRSKIFQKEISFYCILGFMNALTFHLARYLISRWFSSAKKDNSASLADIVHHQKIAESMQHWLLSTDATSFDSWPYAEKPVCFAPYPINRCRCEGLLLPPIFTYPSLTYFMQRQRGLTALPSSRISTTSSDATLPPQKHAVRDLLLSTDLARREIADLRALVHRLHQQVVHALDEPQFDVPPVVRGGGGRAARRQGRSG
jgi:hypothetical protein